MKKGLVLLAILVCADIGSAQTARRPAAANTRSASTMNGVARPALAANSTELPIRRVILYSNGVAYIERRGIVTGNAEINLSFKQSQVDDVLKSMVVLDLGQGQIGAVSYNSSMPASARTAEIPFGIESKTEEGDGDTGGLAGVLSQLQGAKVMVASHRATATGSILNVEKHKAVLNGTANGTATPVNGHTLVIASDQGEIIVFDFADVRSVRLLDEGARRDISEFAKATASTRRRDAKTISVTSHGTGQREMVVSYTVAAPIWKTTYRVVLDEEGKPFFQGWAIVDNVSEEDWKDVQLSLVSGSPVSFIQNLQKPLYRHRPIIPIPDDLELQPQIYDAEEVTGTGYGSGSGFGAGSGSGSVSGSGSGRGTGDLSASQSNYVTSVQTSISDVLVNQRSGIETAATGSELGDLFEYKIASPVTVDRNRSALIPIVQTKMEGERISIYNESVRRERPMGGMILTNTTPLTFEGGSLTVLDRDAYAGEALMERLKPKERRLISFALDLGVLVNAESKQDREAARLVRAVNGVLQIHYYRTNEKIYNVTNQTDRQKIVYIEHPVQQNWSLGETTPKPDITTERFYRFRVELGPFERKSVPVVERQGLMDGYQLGGITRDQISLFFSRRYIDENTRRALERLIDLRVGINAVENALETLDEERDAIAKDQKRLRENIEALAKTPEARQLISRYIAKANEQETRLEQIESERKIAQTEKERLERELATEIRNFEVR